MKLSTPFFLFLFITNILCSQTPNSSIVEPNLFSVKEKSFKEVLEKLEVKHNVKFNYNHKWIKHIKVIGWDEDMPLEETLYRLTAPTIITFRKKGKIVYIIPRDKIEIKGTIRDKLINAPIPDMHVSFEISSLGKITDTNGNFSVKGRFSPNDFMIISHISIGKIRIPYKDWQKNSLNDININFGITIDTVHVSQIYEPQLPINPTSNGSITMPLNNYNSVLRSKDVLQTIQNLSGISSPDDLASSFRIRGSNSFQNLFLWDDIPVYKYGKAFGIVSAFNNKLIDTVAISRSGIDIEHGGRTSGIIKLQTTDKIPSRPEFGVEINNNYYESIAKIPLLKKKSAIFLSHSRSLLLNHSLLNLIYGDYISQTILAGDIIKSDKDEPITVFPKFQFDELNAKWLLKLKNNGKLSLSFFNQEDKIYAIFNNLIPIKTYNKTVQRGIGINWNSTWKNKISSTVKISTVKYVFGEYDNIYRNGLIEFDYNKLGNPFKYVENNDLTWQFVNHKRTTDRYNGKIILNYPLEKDREILVGVESNLIKRNITLRADRDTLINRMVDEKLVEQPNFEGGGDLSLFSSFAINKGNFRNEIGLRNTFNFRYRKNFIEPRIKSSYILDTVTTFQASIGFSHQVEGQPIAFQPNLDFIKWKYWTNISPIVSKNFTVGLVSRKNNWLIELEAYLRKTKNLTHRAGFLNEEIYFPNSSTSNKYINYKSNQTNLGVDLLYQTIFKDKHSFQLNYSWNETNITLPIFEKSLNNETVKEIGTVKFPGFRSPHQIKSQIVFFNSGPVQLVFDLFYFSSRTSHFQGYKSSFNLDDKIKFKSRKRFDYSIIFNATKKKILFARKVKTALHFRDLFSVSLKDDESNSIAKGHFVDFNEIESFNQFKLGVTFIWSLYLEW